MTFVYADTMTENDWRMLAPVSVAASDANGEVIGDVYRRIEDTLSKVSTAVAGTPEVAATVKEQFRTLHGLLEEFSEAFAIGGALAGITYGKRSGLRTGITAARAAARTDDAASLRLLVDAMTIDEAADDVLKNYDANA